MPEGESLVDRSRAMMEHYGFIFVGTILVLFFIEMTVLISLLEAGVDLEPAMKTLDSWTGWETAGLLSTAGTWAIAYAITRVLKPAQLVVAFAITPVVGGIIQRVRGEKNDEATPPVSKAEPASPESAPEI